MNKEEGTTMKLPDKPCIIVGNGNKYIAMELTKEWREKIYHGPKSPVMGLLQNMLHKLFKGEHKKKMNKETIRIDDKLK